jgi:hypothetical protein
MRQIRDILRLKWTLHRSHRQTARSVGVSAGSVAAVVSRATHKGLTWEAVTALTDEQLEQALWGPKLPLTAARSIPDPLLGIFQYQARLAADLSGTWDPNPRDRWLRLPPGRRAIICDTANPSGP